MSAMDDRCRCRHPAYLAQRAVVAAVHRMQRKTTRSVSGLGGISSVCDGDGAVGRKRGKQAGRAKPVQARHRSAAALRGRYGAAARRIWLLATRACGLRSAATVWRACTHATRWASYSEHSPRVVGGRGRGAQWMVGMIRSSFGRWEGRACGREPASDSRRQHARRTEHDSASDTAGQMTGARLEATSLPHCRLHWPKARAALV